ncbi:gfo/Idh/MocA family oxidoreductase [Pediococcus ethanolidurans]|uniref:Gfo/Idh/MocA family protein n=1 Tax=Pediococcus ethanolidurans TaxID=319653 RepID=UPI0021A9D58E|nr:Gfo/Idh/MocA family oxidoreductase [Pediococcus ethanolidurans]MCT4398619.1 gfo/Idh/MocA family oxidoreductase [Pediococcus ethanolidurans]
MIKLGIIGTNWITQQFIDAAHATGEYKLTAVYSRTVEKAKDFGKPNGATIFSDNLDEFFANDALDAVYIASPNSLHFEQAMLGIKNDKAVIIEKPIVANIKQMEILRETLEQHPQSRLFEAARQIHQPNFKIIKNQISELGRIQGATLTYMKYSSRYDAVLAGQEPNVFTLKFAGGALQDLGVYVAYDAVGWFGMPDDVAYYPTLAPTRVDGKGVAILRYPEFDITLNIGKTSNSYLPSEIYGLKDTIVMSNPADLETVSYHDADGHETLISEKPADNPMISEAADFARVINDPQNEKNDQDYWKWLDLSQNVTKLLYNLRQSGKIVFPDDKK